MSNNISWAIICRAQVNVPVYPKEVWASTYSQTDQKMYGVQSFWRASLLHPCYLLFASLHSLHPFMSVITHLPKIVEIICRRKFLVAFTLGMWAWAIIFRWQSHLWARPGFCYNDQTEQDPTMATISRTSSIREVCGYIPCEWEIVW